MFDEDTTMDFRERLTEEERQLYDSLFGMVIYDVNSLFEAAKAMARSIEMVAESMSRFLDTIILEIVSAYPNRRVAHLALHGKKERTRKKNLSRMFRGKDYV